MDILPPLVDWDFLSRNNKLTLDFFTNHLDKPWNMVFISAHSMITLNIIFEYPDLNWDIIGLLKNENLTAKQIELLKNNNYNLNGIDFIQKKYYTSMNDEILDELNIIVDGIKSRFITLYNFNDVKQNINNNWDWNILTNRIPIYYILQNINYNWACFDNFIKPEQFITYYNTSPNDTLIWNWSLVLETINDLNEFDGWNWDFFSLKIFNETIFNKYPNLPWNYNIIININPYINTKFVSSNLSLIEKYDYTNMNFLYRLPDISWDNIITNII